MATYGNSTGVVADSNGSLDWEGETIQQDGEAFILLDEGDYPFTVSHFERGSFPGSAKLPPCNKAELTLTVHSPRGEVNVQTSLILHRSLEWKLSQFFRCIGMKKHGEALVMKWNEVAGKSGRVHIKQRSYISNKDGKEKFVNDCDSFLDPDDSAPAPKPAKTKAQPQKAQQTEVNAADDDDDLFS